MDFLLNGMAHGDVASRLMQANFDPRALRPYIGDDGRSYITRNSGGVLQAVPVANTSLLRKEDWKILDDAIVKAAKPRLRAVADLVGAGLQYTIPNGMSKTILETEKQSDISEATISMDGLRRSQSDRPVFDLTMLPLPIIHKDFAFSMRQIAASRNGGSPLDTTTAELAARRVAEMVERLLLGVESTYVYGGGTIFGYTNFTSRNTHTLTAPTASGWTPATLVQEVLEMKLKSQDDFHYGPWMIYVSSDWDVYLDDDYSSQKGDLTLRERLRRIEGIQDVRTSDYLGEDDDYVLVLVQMTPDVARMVNGMGLTTVQWDTDGGMMVNFKVMTIMVPQLRADYNGNCGIVHGAPA